MKTSGGDIWWGAPGRGAARTFPTSPGRGAPIPLSCSPWEPTAGEGKGSRRLRRVQANPPPPRLGVVEAFLRPPAVFQRLAQLLGDVGQAAEHRPRALAQPLHQLPQQAAPLQQLRDDKGDLQEVVI